MKSKRQINEKLGHVVQIRVCHWRNVKLNLSKDSDALQAGDDKIPLISKIILPSLHFYLVIVFAHWSGLQKFSKVKVDSTDCRIN